MMYLLLLYVSIKEEKILMRNEIYNNNKYITSRPVD